MTTKKDISELKKRFKKDITSIDRVVGCYVNNEKNIVTKIDTTLFTMEDEDMFKYLEIAKKSLSGKIGNNIMQLPFAITDDNNIQNMLLQLRDTKLMDKEVLNKFYEHVIDTYDNLENYFIVLFHDTYDVPNKTSDGFVTEDGTDVFDYIICAICPVKLSKAALGYIADDNSISHITRDWLVAPVESAFMFPSFDERQANIHEVIIYTKNAKEPHVEFWENTLGVKSEMTSSLCQVAFTHIMTKTISEEKFDDMNFDINLAIKDYADYKEEKDEIVTIDAAILNDILDDAGIDSHISERICDGFKKQFGESSVPALDVIDNSVLRNAELISENKLLKQRIVELSNEIKELKVEK